MERIFICLIAGLAALLPVFAFAQGAGADWSNSWSYQSQAARAVDFNIALQQERLRRGTDGDRVTINNASTQNVGGILTINGDGNTVEAEQTSSGSQTGTATVEGGGQ